MEFINIQMTKSVNFSQFSINELSIEEKEVLIMNLQSKITKTNNTFERMINTEKLQIILSALNEDSELKSNIITEIKNENLLSIFSEIKNSDLSTFQIIKKYFNDIKVLLTKDFDLEYSNKYVFLHIQYVMSFDYTTQDIMKTITKAIDTCKLTTEYVNNMYEGMFMEQKIEIEDEQEIEIEQEINEIISNLKIDIELSEEEIVYITKLSESEYNTIISIFRNCLQNDYETISFLQRLSKHYINNSQKYISIDLIENLINNIMRDSDLSTNLKTYIFTNIVTFFTYSDETTDSYITLLIRQNKFGVIVGYMNTLQKFNGLNLSELTTRFNTEMRIVKSTNINMNERIVELINQYKTLINVADLGEFTTVNTFTEMAELTLQSETIALFKYIQRLGFNNTRDIISDLQSIDIITYFQLQKYILSGTFIKMCRSDRKVLSGKTIKIIIFYMLNNLEKLSENKVVDINEFKYERISIDIPFFGNTQQLTKKSIEELKAKRMSLSGMIEIMKEQELTDNTVEQEIKKIDEQICNYYMNLSEEEAALENIDELVAYLKTIKNNTDEENKIVTLIKYYSTLIQSTADNYKQLYEEEVAGSNVYGAFNSDLDKLINKYDKEFTKEDKIIEKKEKTMNQKKAIRQSIKQTLDNLDNKFKTNSENQLDNVYNFFQTQTSQIIKPAVFRQIINSSNVKQNKQKMLISSIMQISKIFTIIYYINKNDINMEEIYEDITKITNSEIKKNRTVLVKSLDKQGTYVGEMNNKIYVNLFDSVVSVEKDDIVFIDTLINKDVKVIKGPKKGLIGTVYSTKGDTVIMTQDLYGNRNSKFISTLKSLKINKSWVKEIKYTTTDETTTNIKTAELIRFFDNKTIDLYPLVKYNYYYNNDVEMKFFEEFYTISLKVYNNMIIKNVNEYKLFTTRKTEFLQNKKTLIQMKKENNKQFITLKKQMRIDEIQIREIAKNLKINKINKKTINQHQKFDYEIIDQIQQIINNHISYIKIKTEKKVIKRKVTKQQINQMIVNESNKVEDLLASLLL